MTDHIVAIKAMRERWKYIEAQVALGQPRDVVQAKQVSAINVLFKRRAFSMEGVTAVCEEMREPMYKLNEADTNMLLATLELSEETCTRKETGSSRKCQEIESPEYFLTGADYEFITDDVNQINPKAVRMGERLASLGVTCPSTNLLKRAAAIVRLAHFGKYQNLSGPSRKAIVTKIKGTIKAIDAEQRQKKVSSASVSCLPHIVKFPACAQELDDERYNQAYPDEHDPALLPTELCLFMDGTAIDLLVCDMVVRKTHKDMRQQVQTDALSTLSTSQSSSSPDANSAVMQNMMPLMMQCMQQMMNGGGGGTRADAPDSRSLGSWKPRVSHRLKNVAADDAGITLFTDTTAAGSDVHEPPSPRESAPRESAPRDPAPHRGREQANPREQAMLALRRADSHIRDVPRSPSRSPSPFQDEDEPPLGKSQGATGELPISTIALKPAKSVHVDAAANARDAVADFEQSMLATSNNAKLRSARLSKERAAAKAAANAHAVAHKLAAKAALLAATGSEIDGGLEPRATTMGGATSVSRRVPRKRPASTPESAPTIEPPADAPVEPSKSKAYDARAASTYGRSAM